jgi:hypothetical protein
VVGGAAGIAAALLAGCGGSGSHLYTLAKTRDCLKAQHLPIRAPEVTDFVASSATGGAFRTRIAGNVVTVSFGLTTSDADNINSAYRRFRGKNIGINDILRQQENAVMVWHMHPEDAQMATLAGCLK